MNNTPITALPLNNIRIVLVATSHPGNIGAAARAMKTMGLNRLYLVAPKTFPHVAATARAAGADDILSAAVIVDNLHDALSDCQLVIGTSARQRDLPLTLLNPREAAALAVQEAAGITAHRQQQHQVAFVFGRESNGLHNDELLQCNYHVYIPANPEFSSLNVASAVQIIAYEIMQQMQMENTIKAAINFDIPPTSPTPHDALATTAEVQSLYVHLEQVLAELQFLRPQKSKRITARLQRLLNRARLEHLEVNILHGIFSAIQKNIKKI